jgi:hypothetical protein
MMTGRRTSRWVRNTRGGGRRWWKSNDEVFGGGQMRKSTRKVSSEFIKNPPRAGGESAVASRNGIVERGGEGERVREKARNRCLVAWRGAEETKRRPTSRNSHFGR